MARGEEGKKTFFPYSFLLLHFSRRFKKLIDAVSLWLAIRHFLLLLLSSLSLFIIYQADDESFVCNSAVVVDIHNTFVLKLYL